MAMTYVFEVKDNGSATFQKINNTLNLTQQNLTLVDNRTSILKQSFTQLNNTTNIVGKSLSFLGTSAATALGSVMSSTANKLKELTKEMVDSYDSAAKLSQNIGITAESVLGLRHAAELSNVGAEAMDKNMEKLSKTMFEAANGNKSAGESFKQLGIEVKNSDGSLKKSDAVLMELADKFKTLPSGAEKAAVAMNIFGKSGASMVSMLKDGSGALKEMVDEGSSAAGNVQGISEAMEKLNDAGTRAKAALMGMLAGVVDSALFKAMVSGFNSMSEALIKWNKESKDAAKQTQQANLEQLANLHLKQQQLKVLKANAEYQGKDTKAIEENITKIQNQTAALRAKVKIDDDELRLMRAQAEALAKTQNVLANQDAGEGVLAGLIEEASAANAKVVEIQEKIAKLNSASILPSEAPKAPKDDSAAKALEAERKRLQDWLDSYRNAKRDERQIAEDNHKKATEELTKALAADLIEVKDYDHEIRMLDFKLHDELNELYQKDKEAKLKAEEEAQNKVWELRKIAASDDGDKLMQIELEQAHSRYDKEMQLAEKNKIDAALIEEAKQSEIEGIRTKYAEMEARRREEEADAIRAFNEQRRRDEEELLALKFRTAEASLDTLNSLSQLGATLSASTKKYAYAYKASEIGMAVINATQSVLKTMASTPFPFNIPLATAQAAAAAVQVQKISAAKMYRGGMIPGSNTLIMANEEGREAILNTAAVRAVGGEAGVNALNRGTSNTYDNSRSSITNINISTSIMTAETYRKEIEPVKRRNERRR